MAPNKARQIYIDGREKPTSGELQAMCLTGGTGAKREMLITGGWDQLARIATPVSQLDKSAVISGTYWLLQGSPRMLCISGRDLWPTCTDVQMSVILNLGDLSQYEFGDLSSTTTWDTSSSVMNKIKFLTGAVKREITPQQAGEAGTGTFLFRLHVLLKAKDSMRVWIKSITR